MSWLLCPRTRAGYSGSDAHSYGDDHAHAYNHPDPDAVDLHEHCLQYTLYYSDDDCYADGNEYLDIYTQPDAFIDTDSITHSLAHSFVDTESYQYAHPDPFEYPYADRYGHRHDHTI